MRDLTNGGGDFRHKAIAPRPQEIHIPASANYTSMDAARPANYLRYLLNRKGTLALFALTGLLLGTLLVWRQPYVYRAKAYLDVMGVNEDLLNKRELDPTAEHDQLSQAYVNTVARLLQSDQLYGRTADALNKPAGGSTAPPWNPPITKNEISKNVRIVTHDIDRILEVDADSSNPQRASAIVNGLTGEFIRQDLETRFQTSNSTSSWLRKELDDLVGRLHASEAELEAYTKTNNMVVDGDEGGVSGNFVRNIQGELARAQADRMTKESIYEHMKTSGGAHDSLPSDNVSDQYEMQLNTLKKQLAELEATYAPDYYKIPPLKAQIAQMEKVLGNQRQSVTTRVENDYRAALRREELLQAQYNAQFRNATDQTAKMVQYQALKNQVEMNQAVYSSMMQKVKGYGVASAMQASNVRIVDPAEPPSAPIRPNKPLTAALSTFGFLCAGVFWLLVRAGSNRNITEPGESQQYLRAPELGVIPAASRSARRAVDAANAPVQAQAGGFPGFGSRRRKSSLDTIAWNSQDCMLAESFRATSASLLLPKQGVGGHQVLVVTSLTPSEGKTTVASNIAISLAGVAGRVLLVDADRRRSRLDSVFGCPNEKGLSDLLEAKGTDISAAECIVETAIPNLHVLPSGRKNLATSDLFYSQTMAGLIAGLRSQYDVVLIDTPPLLFLSDARVLGKISDGVILVIRAGRVPWDSAMAAEQRLAEDGVPVLGTVLNDWNPRRNGYGSYPYDRLAKAYFAT